VGGAVADLNFWASCVEITVGCALLLAVLYAYVTKGQITGSGGILLVVGFALIAYSSSSQLDFDILKGSLHVERGTPGSPTVPNLSPSIAKTLRYKVAIVNSSTTTNDADLRPVVAALQTQVNDHLAPIWGIGADISFFEIGKSAPADNWKVEIADNPDQPGMLSYHSYTETGLPFAKISAVAAKSSGVTLSRSMSHELLNMLVDPRADSAIFVDASDGAKAKVYIVEIADACEGDGDGYKINQILVSNFVYPTWFHPTIKPEDNVQFDHLNRLRKPLELCPEGHAYVYEISSGKWTFVSGTKK
jgi:hypothetical protein